MEDLKKFKADFRDKAVDFASVYHVMKEGGIRTDEKKEGVIREALDKLEHFVLERFNTWIISSPSKVPVGERTATVDPEDTTISLDF